MHFGLNIYHWGRPQQDRLLTGCLGPVVAALREEGRIDGFWFDRFDARGPHLCVLIASAGTAEERATVESRLATAIEEHLAASPSTEALSDEHLAALHEQTRGKWLCTVDREPGIAANNTLRLFDHDPAGYPFGLSRGLPGAHEIWSRVGALAEWAIGQIATAASSPPIAQAVRWAAALDRCLADEEGRAEAYWRYHATTLLLGLDERLATAPDEVPATLLPAVGERNVAVFSRLWAEGDRPDGFPELAPLARLALGGPPAEEAAAGRRFRLLREIVHCGLKQLGVPVSLHIPMVLYAWSRHLCVPVSGTGGG